MKKKLLKLFNGLLLFLFFLANSSAISQEICNGEIDEPLHKQLYSKMIHANKKNQYV